MYPGFLIFPALALLVVVAFVSARSKRRRYEEEE
jgi:hypothetical protein